MKFAKSMRYGGELINAMECDYDSYLNLGVVCPECHESLYLRAGGERVSPKGKPYKIGAHWCHRKGTPEQIAGCELRVNGYTEQDRARIAAQARGQRLKLLQRWFWTVFEKHNDYHELQSLFDSPSKASIDLARWLFRILRKDEGFRSMVITKIIEPTGQALFLGCKTIMCLQKETEFLPPTIDAFTRLNLATPGQVRLHRDQVVEVFEFLSAKKQAQLFLDIASVMIEGVIKDDAFKGLPTDYGQPIDDENVIFDTDQVMDLHVRALVQLASRLIVVPWADEFARLEMERKAS